MGQLREASVVDLANISVARNWLREARKQLLRAGAKKAAAYVSRALKSVEGAYRHADRVVYRSKTETPA